MIVNIAHGIYLVSFASLLGARRGDHSVTGVNHHDVRYPERGVSRGDGLILSN